MVTCASRLPFFHSRGGTRQDGPGQAVGRRPADTLMEELTMTGRQTECCSQRFWTCPVWSAIFCYGAH